MGALWTQLFPPVPTFTDRDLGSQTGRVFIVTGGNNGIGFELVKVLHAKGGTVYVAGRSPTKIADAITRIENENLGSKTKGQLRSLIIDLADLTTISKAVNTFLKQESRLDVLFHNAGIAQVAPGSVSAQGFEAHMGTNCLAPYLLTKLLLPILMSTAKSASPVSTRVVFTSSSIVEFGPKGGLSLDELQPGKHGKDKAQNYAASKAGNWFLAAGFDKQLRKHGIICVTQNPGNLKTDSWNNVPWLKTIMSPFLEGPKFGAYTNLWCGLSEEVKMEDGGRYAIPWGRWHPDPRPDILQSMKSKDEGGTGVAEEFWKWCEEQTLAYAII